MFNLFPIFLVGLLGSVHCIGMCGGIVSALSLSGSTAPFSRTLAYNVGRISSYMIAGMLAGGVAQATRTLAPMAAWQSTSYVLANFMLIALGLYLMDVWRGLKQVELLGQRLWRHIQPATSWLLPLNTHYKLVLAGSLWGWLPCGMVYSALMTAMFSGSAMGGASLMLAFGLGTLPMLFAVGVFGAQIRQFLQQRLVCLLSGALVAGFGVLRLVRAARGLPVAWADLVCF